MKCETCGKIVDPDEHLCDEYNTRWFLVTIENFENEGKDSIFLTNKITMESRGNIVITLENGVLSFSVGYYEKLTIETKKLPEALKLRYDQGIISTIEQYFYKSQNLG